MRIQTIQRTIKTACGKTISYLQTTGDPLVKAHSAEGPAIIYPEHENLAPEYYLHGIKYTKAKWKEALSQAKAMSSGDPLILEQ
jgi:hypothetical protein